MIQFIIVLLPGTGVGWSCSSRITKRLVFAGNLGTSSSGLDDFICGVNLRLIFRFNIGGIDPCRFFYHFRYAGTGSLAFNDTRIGRIWFCYRIFETKNYGFWFSGGWVNCRKNCVSGSYCHNRKIKSSCYGICTKDMGAWNNCGYFSDCFIACCVRTVYKICKRLKLIFGGGVRPQRIALDSQKNI